MKLYGDNCLHTYHKEEYKELKRLLWGKGSVCVKTVTFYKRFW